jgi:hypothetical protein
MKPEHDDSVSGFNEAWDIVRSVFADVRAAFAPTARVRTHADGRLKAIEKMIADKQLVYPAPAQAAATFEARVEAALEAWERTIGDRHDDMRRALRAADALGAPEPIPNALVERAREINTDDAILGHYKITQEMRAIVRDLAALEPAPAGEKRG